MAGRLQGRTAHIPLDEVGRAQAVAAAQGLAGVPVSAVVCSDQIRAVQTAEPIAAVHGLAVRIAPALRERSFGTWEGRPVAAHAAAVAADPAWQAPGGESAAAVHTRASAFLRALLLEPPAGDIVIVSHRETIRALLAVLEGRPPSDQPTEHASNGAVRSVSLPLGSSW